jgi:shikimate kinase
MKIEDRGSKMEDCRQASERASGQGDTVSLDPRSSILDSRFSLVFLIGPRGSGKTTVAALVADQLGWAWSDADAVIEQRAGRSIRDVFGAEGEAGFRAREEEVLAELCRLERTVIATGGGAVLRANNRERMRQAGAVVWLAADGDTLWQRIAGDSSSPSRRPTLGVGGHEEVVQVLAAREPLYRETAHFMVDTAARTPAEVADQVLALLGVRQGKR